MKESYTRKKKRTYTCTEERRRGEEERRGGENIVGRKELIVDKEQIEIHRFDYT
jgi:hypothetical protein